MQLNYTAVDWVTATTKKEEVGLYWWQVFQNWLKFSETSNLYNERWSNGYYAGVESQGLRWGYNQNLGYIMIASSNTADWLWKHIDPKPKKITRLDLCADVLYKLPIELAKENYSTINADKRNKAKKITYYENNQGGQTLYIGSRQSYQFGRLYDKGIESEQCEQGRLWRFEVEYKKPLSSLVGEEISLLAGRELEREITSRVGQWFYERGVLVGKELVNKNIKPVLVQKTTTTVDRKLGWLRSQVQPTVHQLIEAGHGIDVLHSLLLTPEQLTEIYSNES